MRSKSFKLDGCEFYGKKVNYINDTVRDCNQINYEIDCYINAPYISYITIKQALKYYGQKTNYLINFIINWDYIYNDDIYMAKLIVQDEEDGRKGDRIYKIYTQTGCVGYNWQKEDYFTTLEEACEVIEDKCYKWQEYQDENIRYNIENNNNGYMTKEDAKEVGYDLEMLIECGFRLKSIINLGYTVNEILEKYSLEKIVQYYGEIETMSAFNWNIKTILANGYKLSA